MLDPEVVVEAQKHAGKLNVVDLVKEKIEGGEGGRGRGAPAARTRRIGLCY